MRYVFRIDWLFLFPFQWQFCGRTRPESYTSFSSWQRECNSGEERSVRLNRRICNGRV